MPRWGDGSGEGWGHYGRGTFEPGHCAIDYWPEMSGLDPDEQYPTAFHYPDGSVATVFSAYNAKTVDRHFTWMEENNIDGVFLQRFASGLRTPQTCDWDDAVLDNVRHGANAHARTWCVMYDLSGLRPGEIAQRLIPDWKNLVDRMQITKDPSYQHFRGKPLVAIWGVGFSDHRKYTLKECAALLDFLQHDATYGGNAVMVGVPYWWRTLRIDAVADPMLLQIAKKADIVNPWAAGRFTPAKWPLDLHEDDEPDMAWCRKRNVGYMPEILPGIQRINGGILDGVLKPGMPGHIIPREQGAFLWAQGSGLIAAGATMLYVGMFDEIQEGTQIFKCTNTPPVGASVFGTYEGLPPDYYLWLTGRISAMLKKQIPWQGMLPQRTPSP